MRPGLLLAGLAALAGPAQESRQRPVPETYRSCELERAFRGPDMA